VLGNDTDPDGDPLTAALESGPSHGTVTLNADGSFDYTPDADFNGTDTFTYKANDGTADSNIATVTITVTPVNDAPTVTVAAGGACGANQRSGTINLTVADVDDPPAGLTLSVSSSNTALVPNANVVFGGSGANRTLSATAVSGRTGTATLTVTVSDGDAEGTVPVTVKAAGNGNNTVTGTGGADILFGQNGNDAVRGLGANDLLCGGHGNDTLTGGPGADHFGGGPGTDTATDFNAGEGDSTDGT
jgi:VCBS repeat-containing protein